jgi:hypothetical protein
VKFLVYLPLFVASMALSGEVAPHSAQPPLKKSLERMAADRSLSFNNRLRELGRFVRKRYLGRDWIEVERELQKEHLAIADVWEKQYLLFRNYIVSKSAVPAGQVPYDLEIHFAIRKLEKGGRDAGKVVTVEAVARLAPGKPLHDVRRGDMIPRGSAIEKALQAAEIVNDAAARPHVTNVEISYGVYQDRWREYRPYAFEVRVDLAKDSQDARWGMHILWVESRLDAPEAWDGKKQPGFQTSDTLGDIL